MDNPNKTLQTYLTQIVHRFLNTKSLFCELKRLNSWSSPEREEAIKRGSYFFHLTTYSMTRIYLIELHSLLSAKEERSLIGWLSKASVHSKHLSPSRFNPANASEREVIKPQEYKSIIQNDLKEIESYKTLVGQIKTWRDKAIVHLDKAFFDNPSAIYDRHPITNLEIEQLIVTIEEILHKHYSFIFQSDARLEILSMSNVDSVLSYVMAFQRAQKDKKLINAGFRPADYLV